MPAGNNGGGQLNLFMFEVGMITRDPLGLIPDIVNTVSIHPLVVVPSTIRYTDNSRSAVEETTGGAIINKSGRARRQVQFAGTFGVESRGLGIYLGTGDLRFKKVYHEVVRLADAINKAQVDAEKDLARSPLLGLPLKLYDPDRSAFFINFYDFWHGIEFEAQVGSFQWSKLARQGSATGLTPYIMGCGEVGPIVTGGLGTTLINGLFQALKTWDEINELIKSYTLDAISTSLLDGAGILIGEFTDSVNAVKAQIDGATGLVNGFSQPGASIQANTDGLFASDKAPADAGFADPSDKDNQAKTARQYDTDANYGEGSRTGLGNYLTKTQDLANNARDLIDVIRSAAPPERFETLNGGIRWQSVRGDGSMDGLDAIDQQEGLQDVVAAATFQVAVGGLYGMDRDEFAAFLHPAGEGGRDPNLAGSIEHVVTDFDTPETIRRLYGVGWRAILRLNRLLPDEALVAGTVLQIPKERQIGQQSQIDALPTFGSHAGQAAWGSDLFADFRVDESGALALCTGQDVLVQGLDWMIEEFGDELESLLNETPDAVRAAMVQKRLARILLSDRRIASVDQVETTPDASGSITISTKVTAINGGTIDTAQGSR